MAGKSIDETALRQRAAELAVSAPGVTDSKSFTAMATSILAFITGVGQAEARPTTQHPATTDTNAGAGGQSSGGATGSDVSGTSMSSGGDPGNAGVASGAGAPDAGDGSASGGAASGDVFDGSEAAIAALKAKCTALAGRDGGNALLAEFQALGAKSWSGVPAEKYGELYASLVAKGV